MTAGGFLIMLVSVGAVTTLFVWCIVRVLRTPHETEHLHGTHQAHTPDEDKE